MKNIIAITTLAIAATLTTAQDAGCEDDGGNWYCSPVRAITYMSVGGAGSYNRITDMNSDNGQCASSPNEYKGKIAPLDEEVSWHIRGPTILKQFAAYSPGTASPKTGNSHKHHHGHKNGHHKHPAHRANRVQERQVGATVTATIDGEVETWINTYDGTPPDDLPDSDGTASSSPAASTSNTTPNITPANITIGHGWARTSSYHALNASTSNLIFLNHFGGTGSGVFDYTFGASLSYASPSGLTGSPTPQTLAHTLLFSSAEVILMQAAPCTPSSPCGYTRPGAPAHHGWSGARKAFFFEFSMPDTGETSADNIYDPVNMPAIWMLNAQIPRTLQYGNADCSCWGTGCGEFDMFEVLSPGSTKAKSTLHGNKAGGDSNYFDRPTGEAIKVGMVMFDDNIHVKVLDARTDFPEVMSEEMIEEILATTMDVGEGVSLFRVVD